ARKEGADSFELGLARIFAVGRGRPKWYCARHVEAAPVRNLQAVRSSHRSDTRRISGFARCIVRMLPRNRPTWRRSLSGRSAEIERLEGSLCWAVRLRPPANACNYRAYIWPACCALKPDRWSTGAGSVKTVPMVLPPRVKCPQ